MKALILLTLMALPALAEPKAPVRTGEIAEIPLEPKTEKELKAWLEGTKWYTDDNRKVPIVFRDGRFETPLHKGTYTVDKPRVIVMNWGKGTKVRCLLDEQCAKMTELDGEKHVFLFDGRLPADEAKPSRLPPKR